MVGVRNFSGFWDNHEGDPVTNQFGGSFQSPLKKMVHISC